MSQNWVCPGSCGFVRTRQREFFYDSWTIRDRRKLVYWTDHEPLIFYFILLIRFSKDFTKKVCMLSENTLTYPQIVLTRVSLCSIQAHRPESKLCAISQFSTSQRLVILGFNATLTAKVISWWSVTHMCFLAFSHQYLHNFSFQSHLLLVKGPACSFRMQSVVRCNGSWWAHSHVMTSIVACLIEVN